MEKKGNWSRLLCQGIASVVARIRTSYSVRPVLRSPDPKSKRFNLLPFGNACCGIHRPRHHPLSITSLHCRVCIYIYIQLEISVFLKFTMKIILALIATATTASAFVPAVSQNGVPQCTSVLPVVMRIVELE